MLNHQRSWQLIHGLKQALGLLRRHGWSEEIQNHQPEMPTFHRLAVYIGVTKIHQIVMEISGYLKSATPLFFFGGGLPLLGLYTSQEALVK